MRRTKEDVLQIYQEYLEGMSQEELDKKYKTDTYYLFKKHNLQSRKLGETKSLFRKNSFKYLYEFQEITNEIESYSLGFWYADGWVNNKQAGLRLKIKDLNILEQMCKYFTTELTVKINNHTCSLVFSNTNLCTNLQKLGCLKSKTYKNYTLPTIPEHLYRHFIRGFFDGDGTVYFDKNYIKANICGINEDFLNEIKLKLYDNKIESTINVEIRENKLYKTPQGVSSNCKNMYRLFIRKSEDLKRLYDYFYKDSTIYLNRKKEVFDKYYQL